MQGGQLTDELSQVDLISTFSGMGPIELLAIIVSITALFSLINYHFIKLPITLGVMLIGLIISLFLYISGIYYPAIAQSANHILEKIKFDQLLLDGMLCALLFAGAIQINLNDLLRQKWTIALLASVSTLGSTFIVGYLLFLIMPFIGIQLSFIYCLLFGALISPTDPVAVLAILKRVGIPDSLLAKITGESLFNDGIGIVVFTVIAGIALSGEQFEFNHAVWLFTEEALGGIVFGLLLGYFGYFLMRSADNINVEVLLSMALVLGGYQLAHVIGVSGPLTIVIVGLIVGHQSPDTKTSMSIKTREAMEVFWKIVDELLNAILFVLVGFEVLLVVADISILSAGLVSILVVLLARFISVSLPITMMRPFRPFSPDVIKIVTWGGLRGGLSVAMALSLPEGEARDVILGMTYAVVIFSLLIQSLTISRLIRWSLKRQQAQSVANSPS